MIGILKKKAWDELTVLEFPVGSYWQLEDTSECRNMLSRAYISVGQVCGHVVKVLERYSSTDGRIADDNSPIASIEVVAVDPETGERLPGVFSWYLFLKNHARYLHPWHISTAYVITPEMSKQVLSWSNENLEIHEGDKVEVIAGLEKLKRICITEPGYRILLKNNVGVVTKVITNGIYLYSYPEDGNEKGEVTVKFKEDVLHFPYSSWQKFLRIV